MAYKRTRPPAGILSALEVAAIIIGIVIGAGIFKTPSLVAGISNNQGTVLGLWIAGGMISFLGGLCWAELSSAYPHHGGDYHFLLRAYGRVPARLFGWARLTVIQSGSIAMIGFLLGDYASEFIRLGAHSASWYAVFAVLLLTAVNFSGTSPGSRVQLLLSSAIVLGLVLMIAAGMGASPAAPAPGTGAVGHWGQALIFVLLTYSGWNEASYLSAQTRGAGRGLTRGLFLGIAVVTATYLLINWAFLRGLGLEGMARSETVAADFMRKFFGDAGAKFVSLLVIFAAFSTMNGTILTGARSAYALGRDVRWLSFLGAWRTGREVPGNALILQAGITLALIAAGTLFRGGFAAMVEYTAPVFWFFLLLVSIAVFVLRVKDAGRPRPFTIPGFPVTPLLFSAACLYMLYASLAYTGRGALVGVAILATGWPLILADARRGAADRKEDGS